MFRTIQRWLKAFGIAQITEHRHEPGLIMVQIDGFSKSEFESALRRNEMPFLKRLLQKENYRLHAYYPGLPSTTPAVQGELFYGIKQSVPAFFFFDRKTGKIFRMFDADAVLEMERRLSSLSPGLLQGGSSYSNIYTGGAAEAHFCAGTLGWNYVWSDVNPLKFLTLILTHSISAVRMTVLCVWETILAIMDFIYGVLKREDLIIEFKFVFLRVSLCILLRELVALGAIIDAKRGLPVIHLNFIGYDEQAHRRKPGSQTAHWALKGIDKAISRVYEAAVHSPKRHYDLWVYSDHGQAATIPYIGHYGKSVETAVSEIYHRMFLDRAPAAETPLKKPNTSGGEQLQRGRYLGSWADKIWRLSRETHSAPAEEVIVAAIGPLGGVYVQKNLTADEKSRFAKELVNSAKIPLVLMPEGSAKARAWNSQGEFLLPDDAGEVLDPAHPYFEETVKDLVNLCHHPNAGTLTISGWRKDGPLISFPFENGAHAGPGREETDAFALLPCDAAAISSDRPYLRTSELREAALKAIAGSRILRSTGAGHGQTAATAATKKIRLMTYNVHGCIGMDGKHSVERIARVIARHQPDIVALQELDMGRKRTGEVDQPHLIAKDLEMAYHFHPAIQVEEEKYGNAVLSRFPVQLIQAEALPKLNKSSRLEPRGALWVSVNLGGTHIQVINAHLSFYAPECLLQAKALVNSNWAGRVAEDQPLVVCGDFNAGPKSSAFRAVANRLRDAQQVLDDHRPLATWFGHYPIGRIDHVFVNPRFKVASIAVPRTHLDKLASDHLPLIVDLEVVQ